MMRQLNKRIPLLILSLGFLVQCRTTDTPKMAEAPKPPSGFQPFASEEIVTAGRSEKPQVSADGTKLVFVSSQRSQHRNSQAYEMRLDNRKERRLTYQDGEVTDIIFAPQNNGYIYASTTDEDKEDPEFIRKNRKESKETEVASKSKLVEKKPLADVEAFGRPLPRTEIYHAASNGDIDRITREPGFDGNLSTRSDGYVYSSVRGNNFDLYLVSFKSKTSGRIAQTPMHEWQGRYSPDNMWVALVNMSESFLTSKLEITSSLNRQGIVTLDLQNLSLDPAWLPGNEWILFSSNTADPLNFELYWVRRDGKCLTRATYTAESERSPAFSPDGKTLYFTQVQGEKSSIRRAQGLTPPNCSETMGSGGR